MSATNATNWKNSDVKKDNFDFWNVPGNYAGTFGLVFFFVSLLQVVASKFTPLCYKCVIQTSASGLQWYGMPKEKLLVKSHWNQRINRTRVKSSTTKPNESTTPSKNLPKFRCQRTAFKYAHLNKLNLLLPPLNLELSYLLGLPYFGIHFCEDVSLQLDGQLWKGQMSGTQNSRT